MLVSRRLVDPLQTAARGRHCRRDRFSIDLDYTDQDGEDIIRASLVQ